MQAFGDVEHVRFRQGLALVVLEYFDELAERVECFDRHGVLGGREHVARRVDRGFDFQFRDLQRAAEPAKVMRLERFRMRIAVDVVQPNPER